MDIGWIGKGNPEITTDKQGRYPTERGSNTNTIIIISETPKKPGSVLAKTKQTGAKLIEMNETDWVNELWSHLRNKGVPNVVDVQPNCDADLPTTDSIIQVSTVVRPEGWP